MDAVVIEGRAQFQVSASGQSPALSPGVYDVWAAADAYIAVGSNPSPTSANGYFIPGGAGIVPVRIVKDGQKIGSTAAISVHQTA